MGALRILSGAIVAFGFYGGYGFGPLDIMAATAGDTGAEGCNGCRMKLAGSNEGRKLNYGVVPIVETPRRRPKTLQYVQRGPLNRGRFSYRFPSIPGSMGSPQLHCIVPAAKTMLPEGAVYKTISEYRVLPRNG